jgi:hypothetical protein
VARTSGNHYLHSVAHNAPERGHIRCVGIAIGRAIGEVMGGTRTNPNLFSAAETSLAHRKGQHARN